MSVEYTVTYLQWLWQIVGDIKRLSREAGLRPMVDYKVGIECVGDYNQPRTQTTTLMTLGYPAIASGPHASKLPPYLRELVADDRALQSVSPFEVVCAYRCPFPRRKVGDFCMTDPWLWWTAEAAKHLFAHPAWVRYTLHLLQPMHLPYRPDGEAHADLAAQVWSRLLEAGEHWCRRTWLACKKDAEWHGNYRSEFWSRDAWPGLLTGARV